MTESGKPYQKPETRPVITPKPIIISRVIVTPILRSKTPVKITPYPVANLVSDKIPVGIVPGKTTGVLPKALIKSPVGTPILPPGKVFNQTPSWRANFAAR